MSVQAISWVLENSKSKGSTRCVLVAIANHIDGDGEGWSHVAKICKEANCSEDTYRRAVQWAIEHGELEREVNEGGARRVQAHRRPNMWRLTALMMRGGQLAGAMRPEAPASCGEGTPADRGTQPPSQDADPEPSLLEPSWNRQEPIAPPPKATGRKPDLIWDAVIAACGLYGLTPTKSERGAWNRAVSDLRNAGADAETVAHRAREFRNTWPNVSLTPSALARRWNECVARTPVHEAWDGPTVGEDPLQPRARAAVDELDPDIRRYVPRDALIQRAMDVLGQNPSVATVDLVMALEVWVEAHYPLAVPS